MICLPISLLSTYDTCQQNKLHHQHFTSSIKQQNIKRLIHTITADNGKEFAKHEQIALKLELKFYFCKPYHSWERGANEHTNGLIRQYIPEGTDFSEITDKWIESKLNNRSRKRLGYLTPNENEKQIINKNSVAVAS